MEQIPGAEVQPAKGYALRLLVECQSGWDKEFAGIPGAAWGTPPNHGKNEIKPPLHKPEN
jgi:hypothetical protein